MKEKKTMWVVTKAEQLNAYEQIRSFVLGIYDDKETAILKVSEQIDLIGNPKLTERVETKMVDNATQFTFWTDEDDYQFIYKVEPIEVEGEDKQMRGWLDETLVRFGAEFFPILMRMAARRDCGFDSCAACAEIADLAKEFEEQLNWEENECKLDYQEEVYKFVQEHFQDVWNACGEV